MTSILIIGAGGIGSALFQDICRVYGNRKDINIYLMDGDRVEGKNVARQHFAKHQIGDNKAEALCVTASTALGLTNCYFCPEYLPTEDIDAAEKLIIQCVTSHKRLIVIGCVDNHPTRTMLESVLARWGVFEDGRPWHYIDCANSENSGEVVVCNNRNVIFRSVYDPNVKVDKSGDPNKCSTEIQKGNIQTLFTNRKAAIIALELIHDILENRKSLHGIVYFQRSIISRVEGKG